MLRRIESCDSISLFASLPSTVFFLCWCLTGPCGLTESALSSADHLIELSIIQTFWPPPDSPHLAGKDFLSSVVLSARLSMPQISFASSSLNFSPLLRECDEWLCHSSPFFQHRHRRSVSRNVARCRQLSSLSSIAKSCHVLHFVEQDSIGSLTLQGRWIPFLPGAE